MLSSTDMSCSKSQLYSAADIDAPAPERMNPYVLQLMIPEMFSGVPIPDGNPLPFMTKAFKGEAVVDWIGSDSSLMGIWTPASPSTILKIFVRRGVQSWGWLGDLGLNQPLYENYRKARCAAAGLTIRSAAQAAGSFTLAGLVTGTDINQLPPFSDLNYNTLLSYIPNAGVSETAVPVQQGIFNFHAPSGYNEYFTPDSGSSLKVEDYWTADWSQTGPSNGGWVAQGSTTNVPGGGSAQLWSSYLAPVPTGSDTVLPDPNYGNMSMKASFDLTSSASVSARFYFSIREYVANAGDWNTTTSFLEVGTFRVNLLAATNHITLDTGIFRTNGNAYYITLNMDTTGATATNVTFPAAPLNNIISFTNYDVLRPNVMSPCHVFIATRLNAGQPLSIDFIHHYESIPNPKVARVVDLRSHRLDDIYLEQALAILSRVGSGVKTMWKRDDYDRAIATNFFHELARERTAYEAAGPSLKSRLMDLWRRANPYITEAALVGGKHLLKSALTNAGAVHPALGVAGNLLANEFLSAPSSSSGNQYSASPPEEGSKNEYCAADVDYDFEPAPGLISASSDFMNIVNQKSGMLSAPRRAYFPVVPKNFDRETKILFITFSKDPLGAEYKQAATADGIQFHYNSFFETASDIDYLSALVSYAASCSIILKSTPVFFHVNFPPVDGPSWHLAALMAVLGIAGPNIYSGGVSFQNRLRPVLTPIGKTVPKAMLAQKLGRLMVMPACLDAAEIGGLTAQVGPVCYSGYLSSGRPLPPKLSAFLIESPWDCVVLGLRTFKHRITMATDVQQDFQKKSAGYNPATMAPKPPVVSAKVAALRPLYDKEIDALCDRALAYISELGVVNPDLPRAVQRNRESWKQVVGQQGNSTASELQMQAIRKASEKTMLKIKAYYDNSVANKIQYTEGMTKSAKQRQKKKNAAKRRQEESSWAPEETQGEAEEEEGGESSEALARRALGF